MEYVLIQSDFSYESECNFKKIYNYLCMDRSFS